MKVVIRNLSQKALKEMGEELGDPKLWIEEATESPEFERCFNLTLTDGVLIKTYFDSILIDCGLHTYFLYEQDFEKVVIV